MATKNQTAKKNDPVRTKALIADYLDADQRLTEAREAYERAMAARTLTVKAIVDANGKDGLYTIGNAICKISKRDTKDDNGVVTGTTWFFKTVGDSLVDTEA